MQKLFVINQIFAHNSVDILIELSFPDLSTYHKYFFKPRNPVKSKFPVYIVRSHCLGINYYVNFLGGIGSNGFHIISIFGTKDN